MKRTFLLLALAGPAIALAKIDPSRPMLTGRGNVEVRPAHVIIANQTAANPDDRVQLDQFVVTGSLIHQANPAGPRPHR